MNLSLQLSYFRGRSTGNSTGGACAILLLSCIEARNAAHRALSFVKTQVNEAFMKRQQKARSSATLKRTALSRMPADERGVLIRVRN
jgi:hypothetical protein